MAGVSRTVVSKVYHGKGDQHQIARKTQERVRAVIRETGYTPNYFIRDLFLQRREAVVVGGAGGVPEKVSAVLNSAVAKAGYLRGLRRHGVQDGEVILLGVGR